MTALRYRHESSLHFVLRTKAPFINGVLIFVALGVLIGMAGFGNP